MATNQDDDVQGLKAEDKWSRLWASIGRETFIKMRTCPVLVSGLKGLGMEIAKNIVLMGFQHVTIHDTENAALPDLSSQFFLNEQAVGRNRAEASIQELRQLTDRGNIEVYPSNPLTEEDLAKFKVVVLTNNHSSDYLRKLNDYCHTNGIAFIAADSFGLFGSIFVDVGENFKIVDKNGEQPKTAYIEAITKDTVGLVTVVEDKRHDLEDGDSVVFSEVKGMVELNNKEFKVTVTGPYQFSIGDTSQFSNYLSGGMFTEIKKPVFVNYKPLREFMDKKVPFGSFQVADDAKLLKADQLHLLYLALLKYRSIKGALPAPANEDQAAEVLKLAKEINESWSDKVESLDDDLLLRVTKVAAGDLSPMAAFLGGMIGHEVMKAATGKYSPINQWFLFESLECLPKAPLPASEFELKGTRYDGQIAVIGQTLQQKILDLKYFLVGAGAIGCEMLKNWAMMGVGASPSGLVHVTDMDTIEVSNLNRQFLYRPADVRKLKSEVASKAVLKMNPGMRIKAWSSKVAPETETVYNDEFWNGLDGVCNALDNINARLYVDSRCVFFGKSLLESGTLGTKGNVQVIVPTLTESYGASRDPPPKETPVCLLHSFPNNIEHCLQWGREVVFEGSFTKQPEIVHNYLSKPGSIDNNTTPETLLALDSILLKRPTNFDDCIKWARYQFEDYFNHQPRQMLFLFPEDYRDKNGNLFWVGAKRPPRVLTFDVNDDMHLTFVVAAAHLRAYVCGVLDSEFKPDKEEDYLAKVAYIKAKAASIQPPPFVPKSNIKIQVNENEPPPETKTSEDEEREHQAIINSLPKPENVTFKPQVVTFEKDDDKNFHIDFVAAAANLRATAYSIPTVDRLQSKLIAGRIIPAIVTTTSLVTGLVCLEFFKILQNKTLVEYKNSFINLALPLVQQSDPIAPKAQKFAGQDWTLWDRINVRQGDLTLKQLLDYFKTKYNIEPDLMAIGNGTMLYSQWMNKDNKAARLPMKMSELIPFVSKQPLAPGQKYVSVEITASDANGDDVPFIPPVVFYF